MVLGGYITESQNFIKDKEEGEIKSTGDVYLYGKEINDETYAICKSDMMIKGNNPENIRVGSTLSTDEFSGAPLILCCQIHLMENHGVRT